MGKPHNDIDPPPLYTPQIPRRVYIQLVSPEGDIQELDIPNTDLLLTPLDREGPVVRFWQAQGATDLRLNPPPIYSTEESWSVHPDFQGQ